MSPSESQRPIRGRGRGRAKPDPDIPVDASLIAGYSELHDRPVAPLPGSSRGAPSRFKPRMVKRVQVNETSTSDTQPVDHRTRGHPAGRGRGRGAQDIVMSASGAFALGPSAAPGTSHSKPAGHMSSVQGKSGMKRIDTSAEGTGIVPGSIDAIMSSSLGNELNPYDDMAVSSAGSQSGDDGDDQGGVSASARRRMMTMDLNDIGLEHPMAPVTLPYDPRRVSEKKTAQERRKLVKAEQQKHPMQPQPADQPEIPEPVVKMELDHHVPIGNDEKFPAIPVARDAQQVEEQPKTTNLEFEKDKQDEEEVQLQQVSTRLFQSLKEVEDGKLTQEDLHVFQFPRHFPLFKPPTPPISSTIDPSTSTKDEPSKPAPLPGGATRVRKIKQWNDWSGWGKGGIRNDGFGLGVDPKCGTTGSLQGQIGQVRIRQSGKVEFIIGDIIYDVLPAAQPTFHQEVAVLDPKQNSTSHSPARALYVLGKPTGKWIIAPKVNHLLRAERRPTQQP